MFFPAGFSRTIGPVFSFLRIFRVTGRSSRSLPRPAIHSRRLSCSAAPPSSICAGSHRWSRTISAGTRHWRPRLCLRRGHEAWPVRFQTRSGELRATRKGDWFELDFPARPAAPCDPPAALLPALGLSTAQVFKDTRDYLVVVASAGQVAALKPDIAALARIDIGNGGTIVTAPGDGDCDYVVRFFAPSVGIPGGPATGSTTCTLAPYWAARLGKQALRARQLSPRGRELRCELAGDRVKIAGQARLYLQGTIAL